jgi:hypothetical protein
MASKMTRKVDQTGKRFGRLLVIRQAGHAKSGGIQWECLCDCGNTNVVHRSALGRLTNSCGCLMAENRKTMSLKHGMTGSPEYVAFSSMRDRCNNPNDEAWARYGGRGIQVKFKSLQELIDCIGLRPSPAHSVDRINNDGHYEPGNVRWATPQEQRNNRRDSVLYEHDGLKDSAEGWAKRVGIRGSSMLYRIRHEWPLHVALTTPATR